MASENDAGPLAYNWRDVGVWLNEHADDDGGGVGSSNSLAVGRLLRCGQIEGRDWECLGGPRTIINLRMQPDDCGALFEGGAAAAAAGATCQHIHISAANSLEKYDTADPAVAAWLNKVLHAIAAAEPPVLVHCRSGKDRTGVVVAACLAILGTTCS